MLKHDTLLFRHISHAVRDWFPRGCVAGLSCLAVLFLLVSPAVAGREDHARPAPPGQAPSSTSSSQSSASPAGAAGSGSATARPAVTRSATATATATATASPAAGRIGRRQAGHGPVMAASGMASAGSPMASLTPEERRALYQKRHIGWTRSHHRLVYGRQFGTDWARYKQREAQRVEEKRKALAVAASIARQQQAKKTTTTVLPDVINAVHSDAISDEVLTRSRYKPPSVEDQHFFGTWGGIQPWLVDHGINLLVSINEELAGNLTGGKKRANSNAGQVGLELDIDWQKLAGLKNFKTHTIIVNGHGRSVSSDFGDTLAASQQIYGARGNVVAHLVAMYGERSFWHERVNVNVGWMPVGSFFAASPLFCDFMNVAICGNPGPNKYTNGNRDWPSGNMGAVVHVMPIKDFYIMGGLFAVSPHGYNGGISGWSWAQDGLGKFSSPVELGWLPEFGKHHLTGHYKLGYSYDNSRYPDLYRDASGQPFLLSGRPQRYRAGMNSAWLMVDQMLLRHGPGETNGLILLGGAMYTDGKTVSVHEHEWLGMLETGRFWGRPLDTVGMMWQHLGISSSATHQQELSQALGRSFLPNRWGAVPGVQSHENIYELFYSAHVARAMALQPDFQYIQRPSASTAYHDAAVFGLQFTVVL